MKRNSKGLNSTDIQNIKTNIANRFKKLSTIDISAGENRFILNEKISKDLYIDEIPQMLNAAKFVKDYESNRYENKGIAKTRPVYTESLTGRGPVATGRHENYTDYPLENTYTLMKQALSEIGSGDRFTKIAENLSSNIADSLQETGNPDYTKDAPEITFLNETDQEIEGEAMMRYIGAIIPQLIPGVGDILSLAVDGPDIFSEKDTTLKYLKTAGLIDKEYDMEKPGWAKGVALIGVIGSTVGLNEFSKYPKLMRVINKLSKIPSTVLEKIVKNNTELTKAFDLLKAFQNPKGIAAKKWDAAIQEKFGEHVLNHSKLSNGERPAAASKWLNKKKLTPLQEKAVIDAHKVGEGKRVGEYSKIELKEKRTILINAGFKEDEASSLIRAGICGGGFDATKGLNHSDNIAKHIDETISPFFEVRKDGNVTGNARAMGKPVDGKVKVEMRENSVYTKTEAIPVTSLKNIEDPLKHSAVFEEGGFVRIYDNFGIEIHRGRMLRADENGMITAKIDSYPYEITKEAKYFTNIESPVAKPITCKEGSGDIVEVYDEYGKKQETGKFICQIGDRAFIKIKNSPNPQEVRIDRLRQLTPDEITKTVDPTFLTTRKVSDGDVKEAKHMHASEKERFRLRKEASIKKENSIQEAPTVNTPKQDDVVEVKVASTEDVKVKPEASPSKQPEVETKPKAEEPAKPKEAVTTKTPESSEADKIAKEVDDEISKNTGEFKNEKDLDNAINKSSVEHLDEDQLNMIRVAKKQMDNSEKQEKYIKMANISDETLTILKSNGILGANPQKLAQIKLERINYLKNVTEGADLSIIMGTKLPKEVSKVLNRGLTKGQSLTLKTLGTGQREHKLMHSGFTELEISVLRKCKLID